MNKTQAAIKQFKDWMYINNYTEYISDEFDLKLMKSKCFHIKNRFPTIIAIFSNILFIQELIKADDSITIHTTEVNIIDIDKLHPIFASWRVPVDPETVNVPELEVLN